MDKQGLSGNYSSILFFIFPTILILAGYIFAPDIISDKSNLYTLLAIPLFLGLILLFVGFLIKKDFLSNKIKILGWFIFALYWAMQPKTLYFGEDGDFVNAFICIIGVYIFFYIAYHEWLSIKNKKQVSCLNWIAGAASISGIIYFGIELTPLAPWLIKVVADQSKDLLNIFTGNVTIDGVHIYYDGAYAVTIIFACTAVQSMVIFVGMILGLRNVDIKRKIYGLLVTIVPVYFLNLIRNASIVYLLGNEITDFSTAHNIIGKGGSLIALVVLLLIVIKFVPEIFDEITCLMDLPKRKK